MSEWDQVNVQVSNLYVSLSKNMKNCEICKQTINDEKQNELNEFLFSLES